MTGEVDYLIELPDVYDGWSIAVMKDGTRVNRWANDAQDGPRLGYERRYRLVEAALNEGAPSESEAVEQAQKALVAELREWPNAPADDPTPAPSPRDMMVRAADALEALIAEHKRVLAELAAASESASSMTRWGADQRDRADAAEARLLAPRTEAEVDAALVAWYGAPQGSLWNSAELTGMRAALDAADKVRREQTTNQEIGGLK